MKKLITLFALTILYEEIFIHRQDVFMKNENC